MFSATVSSSLVRKAALAPAARRAVVVVAHEQHRRHLSMACAHSVHKLNGILEEYREKNYAQEFPRRFQKDVVKAAAASTTASSSTVSAAGIEGVLHNIGMGHRMSRSEIEGIVREVSSGCGSSGLADSDGGEEDPTAPCVISEDQMLDLISRNWEDHHHGLNQPRSR